VAQDALGIIETRGFTAALEAADAMLKSANVTLQGCDKVGSGMVLISVRGDVGAVKAATDAGATAAKRIGEVLSVHVIPAPNAATEDVLPKLGAKKDKKDAGSAAFGLVETRGLAPALEAADAMVKAAHVSLVGHYIKVGGAFVVVAVTGDVGSVKAATEVGAAAAKRVGELVAVHVLPRPHEGLSALL